MSRYRSQYPHLLSIMHVMVRLVEFMTESVHDIVAGSWRIMVSTIYDNLF